MDSLAEEVKEKTLYGRTGGAATLAVGMASIFANVTRGRWLDLWYHFVIMFEALFILTTLDAGTRVGRYLLQDILGNISKRLGDTRNLAANLLASAVIVAGWGFFVIQGVRDPDGGVKALWPLFGIANQMLAAIAFCVATTIVLKSQLLDHAGPAPTQAEQAQRRHPALALVTLVPLLWLLAVTITAGVQKIFHSNKGIGFLAAAAALDKAYPELESQKNAARAGGDSTRIEAADTAVTANRVQHFNSLVDTGATAVFLVLVAMIVCLSAWEWIRLLARQKPARLHETPPVWLPEPVMSGGKSLGWVGGFALLLALAKELSGETALDRAESRGGGDCHGPPRSNGPVEADRRARGEAHDRRNPGRDLRENARAKILEREPLLLAG
jgi:carbon starvation protein